MTYKEWLLGLGEYRSQNPSQRAGQAAFNYLHAVKPLLVQHIQDTTSLDPFHNSSDDIADKIRTKRFFEYVQENWGKY